MTAIAPAYHAAYLDWLRQKLDQAIILLDDDAWKNAAAHDSITAYQAYLSCFPQGRHVNVAKQSIEALTSDSLFRIFEGVLGHNDYVRALAFTPDGRHFVSAGSGSGYFHNSGYFHDSADSALRLWDVTTGETVRIFNMGWIDVHTVAITPDGRYVLHSGGRCDLETGETICTFENIVAFSPDGRLGLSAPKGGCLTLCDTHTGATIRSFEEYMDSGKKLSAAFAPDGNSIALCYEDRYQSLDLLNVNTGEAARISDRYYTYTGETVGISFGYYYVRASEPMAFSPDGRLLFLRPQLWDLNDGKIIFDFGQDNRYAIFTPDGRQLLLGGRKGIELWDINTKTVTHTLDKWPCSSLVFGPDGSHFASGTFLTFIKIFSDDYIFSSAIKFWNFNSAKEIQAFECNHARPWCSGNQCRHHSRRSPSPVGEHRRDHQDLDDGQW